MRNVTEIITEISFEREKFVVRNNRRAISPGSTSNCDSLRIAAKYKFERYRNVVLRHPRQWTVQILATLAIRPRERDYSIGRVESSGSLPPRAKIVRKRKRKKVKKGKKRTSTLAGVYRLIAIGTVDDRVGLLHDCDMSVRKWVQTPCVRQVDKPGTPVAAARGSRSCTPTMGGIPGPLASRVYHPPSSQQTPPQGYQGLPSRGNEPPQSPSPYSNLPYARPSMVIHDPVTP